MDENTSWEQRNPGYFGVVVRRASFVVSGGLISQPLDDFVSGGLLSQPVADFCQQMLT